MDKHFRVEVVAKTPRPQCLVYSAAKNDYSETFIDKLPDLTEEAAGKELERMLWKSKTRPHLGPYEAPHITFAVGGYVHSVMVQLRTHRILSMDCQSSRYTGRRVCKVAYGELPFEEVFYIRPCGVYQNRHGDRCEITEEWREEKKQAMMVSIRQYAEDVANGEPKESARDMIPQGLRQNFYVTLNARALMHIINVRSAKDSQMEMRDLIDKMIGHFAVWMPETHLLVLDKFYIKGHLTP